MLVIRISLVLLLIPIPLVRGARSSRSNGRSGLPLPVSTMTPINRCVIIIIITPMYVFLANSMHFPIHFGILTSTCKKRHQMHKFGALSLIVNLLVKLDQNNAEIELSGANYPHICIFSKIGAFSDSHFLSTDVA